MPLEIQGLRAGAGASDEQVAAILEQQRRQRGIAGRAKGRDARVGGEFLFRRVAAEVERNAVEQRGVVRDVALTQRGKGLRRRLAEIVFRAQGRIDPLAARALGRAVEAAGGADENGGLARALDPQRPVFGDHFAVGFHG